MARLYIIIDNKCIIISSVFEMDAGPYELCLPSAEIVTMYLIKLVDLEKANIMAWCLKYLPSVGTLNKSVLFFEGGKKPKTFSQQMRWRNLFCPLIAAKMQRALLENLKS